MDKNKIIEFFPRRDRDITKMKSLLKTIEAYIRQVFKAKCYHRDYREYVVRTLKLCSDLDSALTREDFFEKAKNVLDRALAILNESKKVALDRLKTPNKILKDASSIEVQLEEEAATVKDKIQKKKKPKKRARIIKLSPDVDIKKPLNPYRVKRDRSTDSDYSESMRAFVTVIESESRMDTDYISVLEKNEEAMSTIIGSMEFETDKASFVLMVLLKLNKGFICVDVFKAYCNRFGLGANIPNNIATSIKQSPKFNKENQTLAIDYSDLESTRREYNGLWQAYKKEKKAAREEVIAG